MLAGPAPVFRRRAASGDHDRSRPCRCSNEDRNRSHRTEDRGHGRSTVVGMSVHEEHLRRVRRICAAMPEATEKLSHGEPTFFVRKKVFAMFANNHHNDGHIAVWIPAPPGLQAMLIATAPETFFKPPYVGVRGWVGMELDRISD